MAKDLPKPHRILTYPIPGDDKGGRLFVFDSQRDGDHGKNAPYDDVILFCAGFPDDHGAFLPLANRMCEELYNHKEGGKGGDDGDDHKEKVLCGVACLAGYDHSEEKPWTSWKPDGYTFDEWTVALRAAAKALRQEAVAVVVSGEGGGSKTGDETTTFTTVFHDWGCLAGCFYTNRALEEGDALTSPNKIVYLDVLPGDVHPTTAANRKPQPAQTTLREKCAVVLYRIAFAFTFVLQRYLSKYAAQVAFGLSMLFLTITGFVPGGGLDNDYFEALHLDQYRLQYMMFPYWNVMKVMVKMLLFTKGGKDDKSAFPFHLPQLDKVPVLFLYGEGKNAMFHDVNVAAFLNEKHGADNNDDSTGKTTTSTQQSKSMGVPNAAHWLYVQQQDVCLEEIRKFVLAK